MILTDHPIFEYIAPYFHLGDSDRDNLDVLQIPDQLRDIALQTVVCCCACGAVIHPLRTRALSERSRVAGTVERRLFYSGTCSSETNPGCSRTIAARDHKSAMRSCLAARTTIVPPLPGTDDDDDDIPPLPFTNRTAKSGGKSKGNDNFLTPPSYLDVLRQFGTIELDPCGSATGSFVDALREYRLDKGEDGLVLPWGPMAWGLIHVNPPYSQTRAWIEKADAEAALGCEIVMLIAARPGTIAWQKMNATSVCFWRGRLTFLDPATKLPPVDAKGKPTGAMFDSAAVYWGERESAFRAVFAKHGKVVSWR